MLKFHPELTDSQIIKLVGTTKPTIQAVRARTHWNITNIVPTDPVVLGLCKQVELDLAIEKSRKIQNKNTKGDIDKNENKLSSLLQPNEETKPLELEKGPFLKEKQPDVEEDDQISKNSSLREAEKLFNSDGV